MKILGWLFTCVYVFTIWAILTYRFSILCVVLAFLQKTQSFRNSLRAILTFKFDEYLVNTSGMISVRGSVEYYPQSDCRGRLLILRYILRATMVTTLETLPEWNNQDLWEIDRLHLHGRSVKKRVGVFGPEEVKVVETFVWDPGQ